MVLFVFALDTQNPKGLNVLTLSIVTGPYEDIRLGENLPEIKTKSQLTPQDIKIGRIFELTTLGQSMVSVDITLTIVPITSS